MRKLKVNMFLTLDGVMQAPGGPDEDESGAFKHGGWQANYGDDEVGAAVGEFMAVPFDLLLGRKTYDIFSGYWPDHPGDPGDLLNNARKYVASRTLKSVDWNNSTLIEGDVATEVAKLKQEDGPEIQTWGSGDLLQTLMKHGLVDEFRLVIYPVVIGEGKRLFADGTVPQGLHVTDAKVSPRGVVIAKYEPAGDIQYGTVGED
jgi:dihydrofolate reductase